MPVSLEANLAVLVSLERLFSSVRRRRRSTATAPWGEVINDSCAWLVI